jgi:hypothetical protein
VLGEVVGAHGSQDVGLERLEVGVVEGLDRGLFHGAVHPLGLPIRPGMVGLGQPVLDAVLAADAVEDVPHPPCRRPVPVLGQVGESHPVVGQDRVQPMGEGGHGLAQEGGAVQFGVGLEEGDVGELAHPVDGQEQGQLALGQPELADVDVDVADPGLGEPLALGGLLVIPRQAGDAVPLQAAVQGAAGEGRDGLAQAAQHIVQRQQGAAPELDDDRLLGLAQDRAARPARPHRLVGGRGPLPPLGDRLRVQAVAGGQGAGRLLRRLELGSNSRRRAG